MNSITISDVTMKQTGFTPSFREKIELAKLLDRLGVDGIETGEIGETKTDALLIRSLSTAVENAVITVPVPLSAKDGEAFAADCLKDAKKARLQVALPVSAVQMEYLAHKKPDAMLEFIKKHVALSRSFIPDVEFVALDSTRADRVFLLKALDAAVESGATSVTLTDSAGEYLPEEIGALVSEVRRHLSPEIKLGVLLSDRLHMAEASAVLALKAGATEIKTASFGGDTVSLEHLAFILTDRAEALGVSTNIRHTELHRAVSRIGQLLKNDRRKSTPFEDGVREDNEFTLSEHDDRAAVDKACRKLGYELNEDDIRAVYDAFTEVVRKKGSVNAKELEVLVATAALQVPPTYRLESYLVTSGNVISSSSHIRLTKNGETLEGLSAGDGPIDASFLAIEKITGTHYELDDFQIRAVTEGREAMGETVVRLRSEGKIYSGRGLSTDIVSSGIQAYVNALNKIVSEEG